MGAGGHAAATGSLRIYWWEREPHVSVWLSGDPCAAFLRGSGGCSSGKPDLHSLFSSYNIASGRPRIFCVIRRNKDVVGGKLNVSIDPIEVIF